MGLGICRAYFLGITKQRYHDVALTIVCPNGESGNVKYAKSRLLPAWLDGDHLVMLLPRKPVPID